jgi:hypothetical protein
MNTPKEWKLVPVEPTPFMYTRGVMRSLNAVEVYKAMLAAAPTPPAQEDEYDSFVTNCHVISRCEEDKPLFVGVGNRVFCRLDRYTVIPTEQIDELRKACQAEIDALKAENARLKHNQRYEESP